MNNFNGTHQVDKFWIITSYDARDICFIHNNGVGYTTYYSRDLGSSKSYQVDLSASKTRNTLTSVHAGGTSAFSSVSNNRGKIFTYISPEGSVRNCAVSSDGSHFIITEGGITDGRAYIYSNFGNSVIEKLDTYVCRNCAISLNGQYMSVSGVKSDRYTTFIATSSDYGNTWVERTSYNTNINALDRYDKILMSATGDKIIVVRGSYNDSYSRLEISTDHGASFSLLHNMTCNIITPLISNEGFIDGSEDLKYITYSPKNGTSFIRYSNDYGNSWKVPDSIPTLFNVYDLSVSFDGKNVLFLTYDSANNNPYGVWSKNYGTSYYPKSLPFNNKEPGKCFIK